MDLRERALKAAEEERERWKKTWKEAVPTFAAKVKEEFQRRFGEVSDIDVRPITVNMAKVTADGLSFIAKKEHTECGEHINFYLEVECRDCGKMFTHKMPCEELRDIGILLTLSHVCKACWMKRLKNITL